MGVSWNFYFLTNLERFLLTDKDKFYGRTLLQHLGVLLFRHIFDFAHPCKERKYADIIGTVLVPSAGHFQC